MNQADILAMADLLDDVGEESDSMTVEQAVEIREAIIELRRRAAVTLGLVDMQLVDLLESPREFNGMIYRRVPDGKWRPLHSKVKVAVIRAAVADENGEMRLAAEVAERAVDAMADLYTSASTFPKTGALERLGLTKDDVGMFESTGTKLRVEPAKPKEEE